MPQISEIGSIKNVSLVPTGQIALYTVPAGKTLMLTSIYVFPTIVTDYVAQASFRIGLSPAFTEWLAEVPMPNNLTTAGFYTDLGTEDISLVHKLFTGGDVITMDVVVGANATDYTVDMRLFGYLY